MKRIFVLLAFLVGCYIIVGAEENVIERANEVSEERINNNIIMWRNDIYENEYKNKI